MEELRVRAYNVRFGDALLVSVPDRAPGASRSTRRHILIDVGNVLNKDGGDDRVFKAIFDDVARVLDGRPLDLYVMTHEHLDHVQGLFHVASKVYPGDFAERLKVDYAWLTASAAEDYYDTHEEARKQKRAHLAMYERVERYLAAAPGLAAGPLGAILANNNPRATGQCVAFLRTLAQKRTRYVFRGCDLSGSHPFEEARFAIWAPEEDTSAYYRKLVPAALAVAGGAGGAAPRAVRPKPPRGVDASSFYELVELRDRGFVDNLLAIDKAANDTSVVFELRWRGWKLLFAGDAELRSWRMMHRRGVLEPVHFLKVSHHGSHNGTPDGDVLESFLPGKAPDRKKRRALVSTWRETYSGIPHTPTDDKIKARCDLRTTIEDEGAPHVELTFRG